YSPPGWVLTGNHWPGWCPGDRRTGWSHRPACGQQTECGSPATPPPNAPGEPTPDSNTSQSFSTTNSSANPTEQDLRRVGALSTLPQTLPDPPAGDNQSARQPRHFRYQ